MSREADISAFSSQDDQNGCCGLFNGPKDLAYVGWSGPVDTKALSGARSMACSKGRYDEAVCAATAANQSESSRLPGAGLNRKKNDVPRRESSTCLDPEDPEILICEAERFHDDFSVGVEVPPIGRAAQPIVLTIHASSNHRRGKGDPAIGNGGERGQFSSSAVAVDLLQVGAEGDINVSDPANFPPLVPGVASAEESGLYLSPPITMVKSSPATESKEKGGEGAGDPGVSRAETLEATRIAEVAKTVDGGNSEAGAAQWVVSDTTVSAAVAEVAVERDGVYDDLPEDSTIIVGDEDWQIVGSTRTTGRAEALSEMACRCNLTTAAAIPTLHGGGTWAFVDMGERDGARSGWSYSCGDLCWPSSSLGVKSFEVVVATQGSDLEGNDDGAGAGSWLECSRETVKANDVQEVHLASPGEDSATVVIARPGREVVVGEPDVVFRTTSDLKDDIRSAANSSVWDAGVTPANECKSENGLDDASNAKKPEGHILLIPSCPLFPQSPAPISNSEVEHDTKAKCAPQSFRDALMTTCSPESTKSLEPSRLGMLGQKAGLRSRPGPTVVDRGSKGGAVFLWREVAAGKGSRVRNKESFSENDPYYERKRIGAFAHRTKPRGRGHK